MFIYDWQPVELLWIIVGGSLILIAEYGCFTVSFIVKSIRVVLGGRDPPQADADGS